jgi:hypothetical protein
MYYSTTNFLQLLILSFASHKIIEASNKKKYEEQQKKANHAARSRRKRQYSSVGVMHTGHREVLITASVMHLLTAVTPIKERNGNGSKVSD